MFGHPNPMRDGWILKGGYALELRFRQARATKDLDLTVMTTRGQAITEDVSVVALRERLVTAASVRQPDFFVFEVGGAMVTFDQTPEGGARFPVDARLMVAAS